jgi:hypothetical protein
MCATGLTRRARIIDFRIIIIIISEREAKNDSVVETTAWARS